MEANIKVQLISSAVAVITAVCSALYAYYVTDRQKQKQEHDLENLKSELQDKNAERDARRDYEYEARKKLYEEYEPLFFRFSETTEGALFRIKSLANRAAEGKLEIGGWLQQESYYLESTVYYLMAPLGNYKLLRGKLTFVDLRVDKSIYSTYILGKVLFASFSDAFSIAEKMGEPYSPFEGAKNIRQDLPIGITENIVELLIEVDPEIPSKRKVMNLAKFQEIFRKSKSSDLKSFVTMLRLFHPERLPVLWRILIVQAIIYKVVGNLRRETKISTKEALMLEVTKAANSIKISDFDWRNKDQKETVSDEQFKKMLLYANEYLKEAIEEHY